MNLLLVATLLVAAPDPDAASRIALGELLSSTALTGARVSAQVVEIPTGREVVSHAAHELLNPASNVKLVTSAAALAALGPEYRFETHFLAEADAKAPKAGRMKTLYVKGHGDPSMSTERLYNAVSELLHAGLKEVTGDLVVDDSWFETAQLPPGYDQEHGDKAYLAPPSALSLNSNVVGVYVRPGESPGTVASVEIDPPSDYFAVQGQVMTGHRYQRRFSAGASFDEKLGKQVIAVHGYVPVERGIWSQWKKVDRPVLYFGETLKTLLAQRGVKVKGRVRVGVVPSTGTKLLHVASSESLDVVLKRLNKYSSNFVAEQLLRTMGAEKKGAPGTTEHGVEVVADFLESELGFARGTYVMKNGSGLNDANRLSAAQLCKLLTYMWGRLKYQPEYSSALSIAGKDGTLKFRFEAGDVAGSVRGKTGTLEGVTALGGYVQAPDSKVYAFAFLVNDIRGRTAPVAQAIDTVVVALASSGVPDATNPRWLHAHRSLVEPMERLTAHVHTYAAIAARGSARDLGFLRTAYATERDPAVRAMIADALYSVDSREPANVRAVLDSASAGEDTLARAHRAALSAGRETPLVSALTDLASDGNGEAISRLVGYATASLAEYSLLPLVGRALAIAATEAPHEFADTVNATDEQEKQAVGQALVAGGVTPAMALALIGGAVPGDAGMPVDATGGNATTYVGGWDGGTSPADAGVALPRGG